MTELQRVAAAVISDHARNIEFLSIVETCDFLSEEECREVDDLIRSAHIAVTWPENSSAQN